MQATFYVKSGRQPYTFHFLKVQFVGVQAALLLPHPLPQGVLDGVVGMASLISCLLPLRLSRSISNSASRSSVNIPVTVSSLLGTPAEFF